MNTKLFGQFLLEKGYVTREQLLDGIAEQRASTATLGDLAVATGMLSVRDVDAIGLRQLAEDEPFSQAAVNLGLLTEAQLADLLHPHSAERLLLGQILLSFGYIDEETLREALDAHSTESSEDDSDLVRHFKGSELAGIGAMCISVLRSVFKEAVGAPVSFQPVPAVKAVSVGQSVWSQAIKHGPDEFILALQIAAEEACTIASAVLDMPMEHFNDLAQDATCEFLNMVTGHVAANLQGPELETSAKPPVVERPDSFLIDARPSISLLCTSDEIQFTYIVARPVTAEPQRSRWKAAEYRTHAAVGKGLVGRQEAG